MQNELTFRWFGVAGFELAVSESILLVDPFLTRPPFRYVLGGRISPDRDLLLRYIQKGDFILTTHAHYDHIFDVPEIAKTTGSPVFGSANTCRLMEICGVPQNQIRQIRAGDRFNMGGFRIEVIAARHIPMPVYKPGPLKNDLKPPLRLHDYRMDESFSFIIEIGGKRILLWSGNETCGAGEADLLITYFMAQPAFFRDLLSIVKPKLVIPTHWDNLFRPLSRPVKPTLRPPRFGFPAWFRANPRHFLNMVHRFSPDTSVLVPEVLRMYSLEQWLTPIASLPFQHITRSSRPEISGEQKDKSF